MNHFKALLGGLGMAAAMFSACASGEQQALTVSGLDPA